MWGLFAVDSGPRQTLEALEASSSFSWINCAANSNSLEEKFAHSGIQGIVVGTSLSEVGVALEKEARIVARRLGLTLAAIEDFSGNYPHVFGGEVDLLIVESELAGDAVRRRLKEDCPSIFVGAAVRYDSLRSNMCSQEVVDSKSDGELLWIGQPETEHALISLSRILPYIEASGMRLMFRAHPRDHGYELGSYSKLISRYSGVIQDVSALSLEVMLAMAPCLTLTHFSSLAVELGFRGIPVVHVLFPDAGGATLKSLAGYNLPHVCTAGGSMAICSEKDIAPILSTMIFDSIARARVMRNFRQYFGGDSPQTTHVIDRLSALTIVSKKKLFAGESK